MKYSIFLINEDGSGSLIGQTDDLASAQALANAQASGNICRIEFGNECQSTVIEIVEVP